MARTPGGKGRLRSLLHDEAVPGVILMLCAALAMVLANSPWAAAYHHALHDPLPRTPVAKLDSLHLWINDGLMAVFFFVVGLEIKREVIAGNLSDPAGRRMPVIAAVAGMIGPAALYIAIAGGQPELLRGWAIPVATDIAFATGVLALAGRHLPPSLRLFLLTLAIVDDLGAVTVIAVFYTAALHLPWLIAAGVILGAMIALNCCGVRRRWPYLLLAAMLWLAVLHSGVHATVAGVLAALTIPMKLDNRGNSPLLRLEHALTGPSAFVIVPVFGFANAGVALGSGAAGAAAVLPVAVAAGLVVGKQAGIIASIFVAERFGIAPRPAGTTWLQLWGMALLCGIGFTMSLFIGGLAFPGAPQLAEEAKIGIVAGSLISAILGFGVLRFSPRRPSN
ncbi:Na+/H+ antiporter NhaA [Novosphingobium lentum]|uniref:Na+/H+ antiporter NhaA n=1 Tax=Novosphingobium lentum TaxID=145287 RepID=UPI000831D8D1|nr:Na+/H+ antiporter NhaA [Novosphingobium lentum]